MDLNSSDSARGTESAGGIEETGGLAVTICGQEVNATCSLREGRKARIMILNAQTQILPICGAASANCSSSASTAPRCRPARRPAHSHSTRRRHPVRAQYYRRRANLQAAQRLPGLRFHPAVHLRGHGRRPCRPLPQCHRPDSFRRRRLCHRRPQAISQARQSHRRILPGLGFNTDFAPVVDLAFEASKTVMSSRAVSADPKQAVLYAREFLPRTARGQRRWFSQTFSGAGRSQSRHSP